MGSLLNLISGGPYEPYVNHVVGSERSLFKSSYKRPVNFGMQKFRVDSLQSTQLKETEDTDFVFRIDKNVTDLLMDTHLIVTLPNIWSPIHADKSDDNASNHLWRPFEFKWIDKIGANIVKEVRISIGNYDIQKFDGHYLQNVVNREFSEEKKKQFYEMIGHIDDLNDPAKVNGGKYPSVSHKDINADPSAEGENPIDLEPSIRSRVLVIPLMGWYHFSAKQAIPLCCLKNTSNELTITVTIRKLQDWYVIKNVMKADEDRSIPFLSENRKHLSPNSTELRTNTMYQLHRFLVEPPKDEFWREVHGNADHTYPDFANDAVDGHYIKTQPHQIANFDVHLMTTQVSLTDAERAAFVGEKKEYLFKQLVKQEVPNAALNHSLTLLYGGLIANMTIFLQRNDVFERNQWSNYTNRSYVSDRELSLTIPSTNRVLYEFGDDWDLRISRKGSGIQDNKFQTTGIYDVRNELKILRSFSLKLAANEKEKHYLSDIITNIDAFTRTNGCMTSDKSNMHFYSFELDTNPYNLVPTGVINSSFFSKFEIDYTLYPPPVNKSMSFATLCDFENNFIIGTTKNNEHKNGIYEYMYDMYIYIERYNKLVFENGEISMLFVY